ncbi:phage Gp37/Gp68 family protein [Reyranella sp.]|jgi:protein gp37|uniref:phage Gp37/Gp68 family protein n=1 Tax=Reyranella sp. TaxID=1929291 RepID=UPI000BD39334|nr:phage Gp37/Gp68 family protein [Reyranella sp.]OYY35610.1 MAG: hypothetical protein B7Y57_25865 [Rhodospirillales bacterium 35-66-84]OYZ91480.1 MAG: hypothetical protein B7Y08_25735 [Rhodospirillales bacterium 24-66-33]OZB22017.1 MAG: hypothetical protein B7X63_24660 [Rhodospirillales bacterium 39-66-50]HQS14963.1 phage Gp37/Gp68 family protein [Reyranella sp.]HQT10772.1 phage Gp37/Gp68 family protein [Reyranella sp.]
MGDTSIEWTDKVWNPVAGCSIVSPGCTNCYAMKMAHRIEGMNGTAGHAPHYAGLTMKTKAGAVWTGKVATAPDSILMAPLRWRKPARVFVNSMSDLFHEGVADETIDRILAVMALCPQHTFQVLTKRAKRMREYFAHPLRLATINGATWSLLGTPLGSKIEHGGNWQTKLPLPNVWLGVSTEDQARADERIPHLLATPAAKRFISAEPLLGAIDLTAIPRTRSEGFMRPLDGRFNRLDWVIAGGESGPRARPMHPDWARDLRDQCAAAGIAYFFKQWGEWGPVDPTRKAECHAIGTDGAHYRMSDLAWPDGARRGDAIRADFNKLHPCTTYRVGKKAAGAELDGKLHREFPT